MQDLQLATREPAPEPERPPATSWDALRVSKLWPGVTSFLGVSLWAQLELMALLSELRFSDVRPLVVLAYVLPLALLGAGVWTRRAGLLLMGVLVALVPGLALMPEPDQALLREWSALLRVGASLLLYVAVASAGSGPSREAAAPTPLPPEADETPAMAQDHRFIAARLLVLAIMLLAPLYGIFADARIAAALATHYRESAEVARTFLSLTHFFAWSVVAYMMVLTPTLNLEYDRRRLERQLRERSAAWTARRLKLRVLMWCGITAAVALILLLVWR